MSDMVSVPAEKIAALREALEHPRPFTVATAARAVVDAVETEPVCTCPDDEFLTPSDCALHGSQSVNQFSNGEETGVPENLRPSPARDDAEKAIAGLLRNHRDMTDDTPRLCRCKCGAQICLEGGGMSHDWHYAEHLASVIAAHMAAPDELTAHTGCFFCSPTDGVTKIVFQCQHCGKETFTIDHTEAK